MGLIDAKFVDGPDYLSADKHLFCGAFFWGDTVMFDARIHNLNIGQVFIDVHSDDDAINEGLDPKGIWSVKL